MTPKPLDFLEQWALLDAELDWDLRRPHNTLGQDTRALCQVIRLLRLGMQAKPEEMP